MRTWWWLVPLCGLVGSGVVVLQPPSAQAVIPEVQAPSSRGWPDRLADPDRRSEALDQLVRNQDVDTLSAIAQGSFELSARGWAVVGLSRIGGSRVDALLLDLQQTAQYPTLVRTWAAAARVQAASDLDELREMAALQNQFPGLDRPIRLRLDALMGGASLPQLLALSADGTLAQAVAPVVMAEAADRELVELMISHPDDVIRRQAAAFAASKAGTDGDRSEVPDWVVAALQPPKRLGTVPWDGGALYVPGLSWPKPKAKRLIRALAGWWLLLEANDRGSELNQVWNNLYSYSLLTTAGYDMSLQADPVQLVAAIARVEGKGTAREVLAGVGLARDPRFASVLR